MVRCLAEASKRFDMDFMYNLASLRAMRDSRDGKLGIRFVAVSTALEQRRGLLSYYPAESGSGAKLQATKDAMTRFATKNVCHGFI